MSFTSTSVKEVAQAIQSGRKIRLVDVRSPAEFRSVHATVATNVPLDRISPATVESALGSTTVENPLHVICKAGGRSRKACEMLSSSGMTNIVNVEGGTDAWVAAGLPVERGAATIPVDGQVRILMGGLIALGTILAATVHPAWIWLSGVFGLALVISGITGWCGIAVVMAKMPWNQR